MGVLGLWDILLLAAERRSIDQLSGRILAIDASIWTVKVASVFQSSQNQLKCLFGKIVMLRKKNILPIFVFDGVPPALKRQTLALRRRRRNIDENLEIKKRTEIELVKLLENPRKSEQRRQKTDQKGQKLEEINKILVCMQGKASQNILTGIQLEKVALQHEILTHKYELLIQHDDSLQKIDREFFKSVAGLEEFKQFEISEKTQYIRHVEEVLLAEVRRVGKQQKKANMSHEDKLHEQLKQIEKRCEMREMQDKLYRKVIQNNTRIQNGYEIIEGIYHGRKVIQKRKISKQDLQKGKAKRKTKNNYDELLKASRQDKSHLQQCDLGTNSFLAEFCAAEVEPQNKAIGQCKELDLNHHIKQKRVDLGKLSDWIKLNSSIQCSLQKDFDQQQLLQYIQLNSKKVEQVSADQKDKDFDNLDNLPAFKNYTELDMLPHAEDCNQLQNLLTLLGIPFIVAPAEAEAECASLQMQGIVDGIITEDSDVFLFGGKQVFRGVFQNNIRYYSCSSISRKLGLNRQKMIILALLLGSDYTDGVKGIGIVNSMEIIKVFPSVQKLARFKQWAIHSDLILEQALRTENLLINASSQEQQFYSLHRRFKNYWYLDGNFPDQSVVDAYLKPQTVSIEVLRKNQLGLRKINEKVVQKVLQQYWQIQKERIENYLQILRSSFSHSIQKVTHPPTGQLAIVASKRLQRSLNPSNFDELKDIIS